MQNRIIVGFGYARSVSMYSLILTYGIIRVGGIVANNIHVEKGKDAKATLSLIYLS